MEAASEVGAAADRDGPAKKQRKNQPNRRHRGSNNKNKKTSVGSNSENLDASKSKDNSNSISNIRVATSGHDKAVAPEGKRRTRRRRQRKKAASLQMASPEERIVDSTSARNDAPIHPNQIRAWFEGLSSSQRSAALAFKDDDYRFLSSIVRLGGQHFTISSLQDRIPHLPHDSSESNMTGDGQTHQVNWNTLVSLKEVEQAMEHPSLESSTTTAVASGSSVASTVTTNAMLPKPQQFDSPESLLARTSAAIPDNSHDHDDIVAARATCSRDIATAPDAAEIILPEVPAIAFNHTEDDFRIQHSPEKVQTCAVVQQHSPEPNPEPALIIPEDDKAVIIPHETTTQTESKDATYTSTTEATAASIFPEPNTPDVELYNAGANIDTGADERTPSDKVDHLMSKLCAIFPAAFEFSSNAEPTDGAEHAPFITLDPKFLESLDGQDVLATLDELVKQSSESDGDVDGRTPGFLSHFYSNAADNLSSPWIGQVKRRMAESSLHSEARIELYKLLLFRFEMAIHDSFHKSAAHLEDAVHTKAACTNDEHSTTKVPSLLTNGSDGPAALKVADETVVTKSSEPSLTESLATSDRRLGSELQGLLDAVVQKADKLRLDASKGQDFFLQVENGSDKTIQIGIEIQDLLISPVVKLATWASVASPKSNNFFHSWNASFGRCLKDFDEKFSIKEKPPSSEASPVSEATDAISVLETAPPSPSTLSHDDVIVNQSEQKDAIPPVDVSKEPQAVVAASATNAGGSNPPKKKNKKKKKKKRKNSTADASTQTKDAAPDDEAEQPVIKPIVETEPKRGDLQIDHGNADPVAQPATAVEVEVEVEPSATADAVTVKPANSLESEIMASSAIQDAKPQPEETSDLADVSEDAKTSSDSGGLAASEAEDTSMASNAVAPTATNVGEVIKEDKDNGDDSQNLAEQDLEDDGDAWETVEVRAKTRKKQSGGRFGNQHNFGSSGHSSNGKKPKAPRSRAGRKGNINRKMVREILSTVLDSVDEEVKRQKGQVTRKDGPRLPVTSRWPTSSRSERSSTSAKRANTAQPVTQAASSKKDGSMRDVLMGKVGNETSTRRSAGLLPKKVNDDAARHLPPKGRNDSQKRIREKSSALMADQNTAPTLPETLSAVSATSLTTHAFNSHELIRKSKKPETPTINRNGDTSSAGGTAHKPKPNAALSTVETRIEQSVSPPLPTLLSPENVNSANSSVASSLEAPHSGRHHLLSSMVNENDVGYHLLDVCERLTRDMALFMHRRSHALNVRRAERAAVLGALQDTLTSIWPGRSSVEMYGSCATQLDLPSSDLDVVVCGLDCNPGPLLNAMPQAQMQQQQPTSTEPAHQIGESMSFDSVGTSNHHHTDHVPRSMNTPPRLHHGPMMIGGLTPNGERVLRLAKELARQPWAVHVKPIPTASVPVVKILADPARLAAAGGADWLLQQQQHQQSLHPATTGEQESGNDHVEVPGPHQEPLPFHSTQTPPIWRGADVENGLLKVDITFEGPEHGGIGSTEFSARVVQEFCNETGLPPEGTPAVQTLMVLKELLAQRRLNEPFSGGLSSYALLLLVVSIIRERSVIREELDRVERQRRMVAEGVSSTGLKNTSEGLPKTESENPYRNQHGVGRAFETQAGSTTNVAVPQQQSMTSNVPIASAPVARAHGMKPSQKSELNHQKGSQPSSAFQKGATKKKASHSVSSSWASIAKKSSSTQGNATAESKPPNPTHTSSNKEKAHPASKKMTSFADAVSKGTFASKVSSQPPATNGSQRNPKAGIPGGQPKVERRDTSAASTPASAAAVAATSGVGEVNAATAKNIATNKAQTNRSMAATTSRAQAPPASSSSAAFDASLVTGGLVFPQGFHDVIEVLSSGETTSGKLLMHFLLFYGQHFDSQATALDYSGKHERDFSGNQLYSPLSPYIQRRSAGSYDPMTGMLTVDPIVVYDPLEGAENNNVARSCFAWSSIRWVYAQSYMTLSNAAEMSGTSSNSNAVSSSSMGKIAQKAATTPDGTKQDNQKERSTSTWSGPYSKDESGNNMGDPNSPLLELLLTF